MPRIIDYETVLVRMREQQMRSLYYNSGAFGFDTRVPVFFTGWIGPDDPTIRPAALEHARRISPPYEQTLVDLASRAWKELLPGPVWVMPKSQWAYELDFGGKTWLPDALRNAGIDPAQLEGKTNSPAIEFMPEEAERFSPLASALLHHLMGSDFALGFPGRPVACTLHHHKQIWWTSNDSAIIERLQALGS